MDAPWVSSHCTTELVCDLWLIICELIFIRLWLLLSEVIVTVELGDQLSRTIFTTIFLYDLWPKLDLTVW